MKAIIWKDENAGRRVRLRTDIPAEHRWSRPTEYRQQAGRDGGRAGRGRAGGLPRRPGARRGDAEAAASARAPSPARSCRCCAARRSRTRACSRCSTRSSTSCRRRSTCRRSAASSRAPTNEMVAPIARTTRRSSALAFKIMTDPFVGTLTFVRVYSGVAQAGDQRAEHAPRTSASASAACCRCTPTSARTSRKPAPATSSRLPGLKQTTTGDTLCDPTQPDRARADGVPRPGHRGRGRAEDQGRPGEDGRRAGQAGAARIRRFRVTTDHETGQTIIKGMGELHLEIIVDRMKREFKVDANVGAPQVAYRETITKTRRGRLHAQEADRRRRPVRARQAALRAAAAGLGLRVRERDRRRHGAEGVHPGVEKGLESARRPACIAGFPMIDFKATLIDGAYHDVDSACWRSRSPRAPPSAKGMPKAGRSCSSRS